MYFSLNIKYLQLITSKNPYEHRTATIYRYTLCFQQHKGYIPQFNLAYKGDQHKTTYVRCTFSVKNMDYDGETLTLNVTK